MILVRLFRLVLVSLVACSGLSFADDWSRFRGPNGSGATDARGLPVTWSDTENIVWKLDLPGPGSSSPVSAGPHVFVTCYTGYGVSRSSPGDITKLQRHLLCVDRATGGEVWRATVASRQREDRFEGFLCDHGYATHTPVTDGERVFVFFGKEGVYAYDLTGKQLWRADVGTGSGLNGWGSGASPVLVGDILIINANAESEAVVGLDKRTGREVWRASTEGYKGSWTTPVLLQANGKTELVVHMPGEVWGLDPTDGGLLWFCTAGRSGGANVSAVTHEGVAYILNGGPGGSVSMAIRGGGRNDVSKTHVVWQKSAGSYVPSPVLVDDKLMWVDDRGQLHALATKTGDEIFRERLPDAGGVYASMVSADGKLFAVSRRQGTFVLKPGNKVEQLAHNRFASDETDFNASPAIHDGRLFLRSNQRLYCVGIR